MVFFFEKLYKSVSYTGVDAIEFCKFLYYNKIIEAYESIP